VQQVTSAGVSIRGGGKAIDPGPLVHHGSLHPAFLPAHDATGLTFIDPTRALADNRIGRVSDSDVIKGSFDFTIRRVGDAENLHVLRAEFSRSLLCCLTGTGRQGAECRRCAVIGVRLSWAGSLTFHDRPPSFGSEPHCKVLATRPSSQCGMRSQSG
jgi:hypothetical protein